MKITDVRAHHIRIPYDAGVASFRQGAPPSPALDMVMVEVTTDAGLTGWGDAFAYVCPRTTRTAVEEMIAPQARGLEVPDAAGIPAFMEQIQRNLHLFGRYGITMFAISGLDIALWDLAAKVEGRAAASPDRRAPGARGFRPMRACCGSARPTLVAGECETALRLGYGAIKLHETTTPAVFAARAGDRPRHSADGRHELPAGRREPRSRSRMPAATPQPMFLEEPVWPPEDFATLAEVRSQRRARRRGRRERLHGASIPADDEGGRREPRPALGDQGRRHHRISEGRGAGRSSSASGSCRTRPISGPGLLATLQLLSLRDDGLRRNVLHEARRLPLARPRRCRCEWQCRGARTDPGSATSRTRRSWSNTAWRDRARRSSAIFAPLPLPPAPHPCAGASAFFTSSAVLLLRRLQIVDDLLQAGDRALQRLDLAVGGVELLLMVDGELGDRLLQEVDIALQATGAPLHGLFDGADFDAGNILRDGPRQAAISSTWRSRRPGDPGNHRILIQMRSHTRTPSRQFARSTAATPEIPH